MTTRRIGKRDKHGNVQSSATGLTWESMGSDEQELNDAFMRHGRRKGGYIHESDESLAARLVLPVEYVRVRRLLYMSAFHESQHPPRALAAARRIARARIARIRADWPTRVVAS